MTTDARFDKIHKIIPHDNADSLEIAIVSNFPCIVRKGEFNEGEWCFYIRDDSSLIGWQEKKDNKSCTFDWQESLIKYLGSNGRVKTIKLRGKTSMGILLKPEVVWPIEMGDIYGLKLRDENYTWFNDRFSDPDSGTEYLEDKFGIRHWTAPQTSVGQLNVKYCGLPEGISKSDSENWENLPESDLHLGKKCLVTQKLDGTATLTTCYPDGRFEISSRSNTFKDETNEENFNIYQKFTKEIVKAGLWYAKKHNKIIAFRSETCCPAVQKMAVNKDWQRNDSFVYGCEFPQEEDFFLKHGCYGTNNHFKKIVDECNANGFHIKHVPIIGEDIVSIELLRKYNDMPADFEGVVINVDCTGESILNSFVWQYKSKSREYLLKVK